MELELQPKHLMDLADAALEDVERKRHKKEPFKHLEFCLSKLELVRGKGQQRGDFGRERVAEHGCSLRDEILGSTPTTAGRVGAQGPGRP